MAAPAHAASAASQRSSPTCRYSRRLHQRHSTSAHATLMHQVPMLQLLFAHDSLQQMATWKAHWCGFKSESKKKKGGWTFTGRKEEKEKNKVSKRWAPRERKFLERKGRLVFFGGLRKKRKSKKKKFEFAKKKRVSRESYKRKKRAKGKGDFYLLLGCEFSFYLWFSFHSYGCVFML